MFKIIIIFLAMVFQCLSEESKSQFPGAPGMTFVNVPVTNGVGDLGKQDVPSLK